MFPYKYFVFTAVFFFVGNTLIGFIKNLLIESDTIGKELLKNVQLSYISIITFLVFGCIANAELADVLFAGSGEFSLFIGATLFSLILCGFFFLTTLLFFIEILFTKISEEEETLERVD